MVYDITTIDLIIILIYVAGMIGIGVYARTKIKSVDDFLVAGNRFKVFPLVASLMAALIGAGMTMGIVGNAYDYGAGIVWNYIGFAVGLLVFGICYVTKLRSTGKRTMAEIIAGEFGRVPRFFVGILVLVYALGSVAICITGMGRLITYIGGDLNISITTAVVITSLITVSYTALGGLYSVVWTDVVQFVIMIGVVVILGPYFAITNAGGVQELATAMTAQGVSLFNPFTNVPVSYIVASFVLMSVSVPGDPTVPQRALAGQSDKIVKKSFIITSGLAVLFGIGLLFIGAGAVAMMPDIAETYGTTEAAFPVFIIKYYPPVLTGIGIAALLAAIMSTISAMLLVGTTHLVYDAGRALKPDLSDDTLKKALPIAIVVIGALVTYVALQVTSIVGVMYFIFSLCGSAFLFPMLFTLYWKQTSKWGITSGIVGGAVVCMAMYFSGHMGFGGDPVYTGAAVSVVATVIISYLLPGGRVESGGMMQS